MAIRDMKKTAEKVEGKDIIPWHYQLTLGEINDAFDMIHKSQEDEFNAIMTLFYYGFILGNRATRAGKVGKL